MKFNHVQQINFMVLNAEAVNRFIQDEIEYKDIIPFIFSIFTYIITSYAKTYHTCFFYSISLL